jgi:hypothetical protein
MKKIRLTPNHVLAICRELDYPCLMESSCKDCPIDNPKIGESFIIEISEKKSLYEIVGGEFHAPHEVS